MRDSGLYAGDEPPDRGLHPIPLYEVDTPAAEALMQVAADRLNALIAGGRRHYGSIILALGDRATWAWLRRTDNPYLSELDAVRRRLGQPGAVLLNMSYEWSCTSGVDTDPDGEGSRLLRTLDWPLDGLGRNVVIARQQGAAGPYYSVTWPGYVGVLTAMAPGRFSAAINQPPLRRYTYLLPIDWIIGRISLWGQPGLPPSHLLRRVFDECRTYEEAKRMLVETRLCIPAFFSLAGCKPGEGCVVERLQTAAVVHEAPASISNHWVGFSRAGHDRGHDSHGRRQNMSRVLKDAANDFSWLKPPILNRTTRLAAVANAASRLLCVQGWEKDGPATTVFMLQPS